MRKKVALATITMILGTTTIVWANNIDIYKEGNKSFVVVEDFIKKIGGTVSKNEDKLVIRANYKDIEVDLNSPFANINGNYSSIEMDEVDGYNVPTDTKIIDKKDNMYIPVDFFKENNIADYSIEGDKVIIKDAVESDSENEDSSNSDNMINRPSDNNSQNNSSNQSNNNQNSNNRPNYPNRPNRPSTPNTPDNPSVPDNPGTPDNPSIPDKPDKPDIPNDPKPPSTGNGDSGSNGDTNPPSSGGDSGDNEDNGDNSIVD